MRRWLVLAVICLSSSTGWGQTPVGAMGDSLLDEHFDQDGPLGISLGYSRNAFELLVETGRIDAGPRGDWGGTRGSGYEYNWALAGSTTGDLIDGQQHINLASQAQARGITRAVMIVGSNDLFPFQPNSGGAPRSDYEAIYRGMATQEQTDAIAARAVANVVTAARTVRQAGVDLIVATAPDYGIAPLTKFLYQDHVGRDRVDDVMERWNAEATERLINDVRVPVVDLYRMTKDIWGNHGSENSTFQVGGVDLDLNGTGGVDPNDILMGLPVSPTSDTVDVFTHDGIHPNTAINGVFANTFLTAFNEEFGDEFLLFSEQEILANAGPGLGSMYEGDTLFASLGGKTYSDYIYAAAIPEPNSLVLLAVASAAAGLWLRQRRGCGRG